jgi:hypothetical protein
MKNFLILLLFIGFFSCKKEVENKPLSSLTFIANGVQYEWNSSMPSKDSNYMGASVLHDYSSSGRPFMYRLYAVDLTNPKYYTLSLDITRDTSLNTSSYSYKEKSSTYIGMVTLGMWDRASDQQYVNASVSDSVSVTITELKNGFASGTFEALLTNTLLTNAQQPNISKSIQKIKITDGVFKNLKIVEKQ